MADLTITTETKNNISITNENKPTGGTWASFPGRTWADGGTWGQPGTFLAKESKNNLSISNESKP